MVRAEKWPRHSLKSSLAAQLQAFSGHRIGRAASVGGTRRVEPTATEGGDPSGTYKRWFGCASGRAGWWRGSSLVGASYWPGGHRGMRAGSLSRARPGPTDGRSDAVAVGMTLVRTE